MMNILPSGGHLRAGFSSSKVAWWRWGKGLSEADSGSIVKIVFVPTKVEWAAPWT